MSGRIDRRGLCWGFCSYVLWGFFPVYWKWLSEVSAIEILVHRIFWSFVFYLLLYFIWARRSLSELLHHDVRDWAVSTVAGSILAANWGLYIWAVNAGHVLETSLAYFINPIMNVAVGVVVFREEFPLILRLSVAAAVVGVLVKIGFGAGQFWISLTLASTFCAYGVLKKIVRLKPTNSSVLEGAVIAFPAVAAIVYFAFRNEAPHPPMTWLLLVMAGVVTGLPLFLFSYAVQRIPYSIVGMLQFIAPTLQFLTGVFLFREHFGGVDAVAFGSIWVGMLFYLGYQAYRASPMVARTDSMRGSAPERSG